MIDPLKAWLNIRTAPYRPGWETPREAVIVAEKGILAVEVDLVFKKMAKTTLQPGPY